MQLLTLNHLLLTSRSVVLFECHLFQFDEGRANLYEGLTAESIKDFISSNSMPIVIEFTQEVSNQPKYLLRVNLRVCFVLKISSKFLITPPFFSI